jgi:hypothetical protein
MNKNVKIGICLLLLVCGLIFMGAINKREGLESRSNSDENRPKCIKPSSLDGNCGPVRKNKKGLSYKACHGHCDPRDPMDCYDDNCEKYGLIIKESKNGGHRVQSGPIDMSEIDTVTNSNISNWPVKKGNGHYKPSRPSKPSKKHKEKGSDSPHEPYPRGHSHNNTHEHYHDHSDDDCDDY